MTTDVGFPGELFLQRVLSSRNPSHAYFFFGSPLSRKEEKAREFGMALLCANQAETPCGLCIPCKKIESGNHPDFRWLKPDGERIKLAQVLAMKGETQYGPMEGPWKIIVISQSETLTEEAAQSLLKILEEPPGKTIFILIAVHPAALLPTLVSRCQRVPFPSLSFPVQVEELVSKYSLPPEEAAQLLGLELAWEEVENGKEILHELSPVLFSPMKASHEIFDRVTVLEDYKEKGEEIIRLLLAFCRDVAVCKAGWEDGMRFPAAKSYALQVSKELSWSQLWEKCQKISEAEKHLKHSGNFRLVFENLLWKFYHS